MSLYVYCLSDELTEAGLAGARGLNGEPARLSEHAGLKAVVSAFGEAPAPVTREHVLAHNRVNAQVLAVATPLPFRFGTLTTAERLASYIEERGADLRAALADVRGCVEMSVKLMWDAGAGPPAESPADAGGDSPAHAGTAFLLAKRRELLGEEDARRRAEELAAWLGRRTSDLARASDARVRPADSLVVRAAHLVAREQVAEYRDRLRALRAERPDLRFLTSGPWPPYSFTKLN
jgi:Gas vesicle synthesis protein GvpL/GvpF